MTTPDPTEAEMIARLDEIFDTSPLPSQPADAPARTTFEGDLVLRSTVKITKAGDGLSDALKVDPIAMHRGDDVYFVLHGNVRHVAFPPEKKDSNEVVRQHVIDTVDIALVDEAAVDALLKANRDRVQRGLDSMKGQLRTDDLPAVPDLEDEWDGGGDE